IVSPSANVSIYITTFNVNGKSPPEVIRGWFPDGNTSDFYAIGLQEMDLSVGTFIIDNPKKMEEWLECIRASLPGGGKNFRVVTSMRLIGIFMVLFPHQESSVVKVSKINSAYMATGISMFINKLGNKGGTAISLKLNDTLVCFVNCHLAAGTGELERRNQDFRDISQITFADGLSIYDHSNACVRHIASSSEFPLLFRYDQLREQQSNGQVFIGFQEPDILPFRPTYKYDVGTSTWDSSEKARVPAWCDRILWWTRDPDTQLKVCQYESAERIVISDHKPVRAAFNLSVRKIDQAKADRIYDEAIREADRRANELLPQVSLSMTEISLTVVIDKEIAWELTGTKLQDILVMNLEHGRDYFIPVMAQYYPRVFGVSLEHLLTKKKDTVVGNLIDFVSYFSRFCSPTLLTCQR
ncbi:endonuclease/exonuclease/phosphatase family protein, partial [Cooperia oncophora]